MSALLRRDGETKPAHEAFLLYASMPDRSLEAVAEQTGKRLKTIEKYSEQYDWPGRIQQLEQIAIANSADKPNIAEWPIECQRRKDESVKAHTYFVRYVLLGTGRSLVKLGCLLNIDVTWLEDLSVKYEWQKRLQAHHDWEVKCTLEVQEKERAERVKLVNQDEWSDYQRLINRARDVIDNDEKAEKLSFRDAVWVLQVANSSARNSLRMDARTPEEDMIRAMAELGIADLQQVIILSQGLEAIRRQQREYQRGEYKPTETSGENVINLYEVAATNGNGHNGNGHHKEEP